MLLDDCWQGLIAFVRIEFDSASFVLETRGHAGLRSDCCNDAVERDPGVSILVDNVDDLEAMDVFEMLANGFGSNVRLDEANDNVSGGSVAYSPCDMASHIVLALVPIHLNLQQSVRSRYN